MADDGVKDEVRVVWTYRQQIMERGQPESEERRQRV